MFKKNKNFEKLPKIIILEDDPDQLKLLVDFASIEAKNLLDDKDISYEQKQKLNSIKIIEVSDIKALQKAVSKNKNVLLAILDCNTPDTAGSKSHDQLVTTGHIVTGQHKSVDIVTKHLPGTPITMISSLDRFQRIINRYYESQHNLNINFIRKTDQSMIQKNIGDCLRQYLEIAS